MTNEHYPYSNDLKRELLRENNFIFSTGIENSDPLVDNIRRNQLFEAGDFYTNYRERLKRISDIGIRALRFGEGYSQIHRSINSYNWDLTDRVVQECNDLHIEIYSDLLHFGLPDWLHYQNSNELGFQNTEFPYYFGEFCKEFAKRYKSIRVFTPVNEPTITALFSAKFGLWNESIHSNGWIDSEGFVKAITNLAKAAIIAKNEIMLVRTNSEIQPIFAQNDSCDYYYTNRSNRKNEVKRLNLERFAALDLIFGLNDPLMKEYLFEQNINEKDYNYCMEKGSKERTVLGIDFYPWCIHKLQDDGSSYNYTPQDKFYMNKIVKQYLKRYPIPAIGFEINAVPEHSEMIFRKTYNAFMKLQKEGFDILGMGWFGDDHQLGWQCALKGPDAFEIHDVGLYNEKGIPNPVANLLKRRISAQNRYSGGIY